MNGIQQMVRLQGTLEIKYPIIASRITLSYFEYPIANNRYPMANCL